jgi:hypothetical protein
MTDYINWARLKTQNLSLSSQVNTILSIFLPHIPSDGSYQAFANQYVSLFIASRCNKVDFLLFFLNEK